MRQGLVFGILPAGITVEVVAKRGRDGVPSLSAAGDGTPDLPECRDFATTSVARQGLRAARAVRARTTRSKIVKKSVYAACAAALLFGVAAGLQRDDGNYPLKRIDLVEITAGRNFCALHQECL